MCEINNGELLPEFKMNTKLSIKKYQKALQYKDVFEYVENFDSNGSYKFKCKNSKFKFENIDNNLSLYIKPDWLQQLSEIQNYLPSSLVNLVIDMEKTKSFHSEIHFLYKNFNNIPTNLKLLNFIFVSGYKYLDNKYGYLNFLFDIKVPHNLKIKIYVDNIMYDVVFDGNRESKQEAKSLKLISQYGNVYNVFYAGKPEHETILYV